MVSILGTIGPVIVGPSWSHTALAHRRGLITRDLVAGTSQSALIESHSFFAPNGEGQGTDKAIVGGPFGFQPVDERRREALTNSEREGLPYGSRTPPPSCQLEMEKRRGGGGLAFCRHCAGR
jgi:iron-sulfur-dependent L-serine dehydratase beta subunit